MTGINLLMIVTLLLMRHVVMIRSQLTREKLQLLRTFVLHQNYTRCSLTKAKREVYETCEIHDEADAIALGKLQCPSNHQTVSQGWCDVESQSATLTQH